MTIPSPLPITESDLAGLGMNRMAYLRPAQVDGIRGYAICAADGTVIGFAPSRDKAIGAIIQNDLEPVALH
jgi:hypothetical protein